METIQPKKCMIHSNNHDRRSLEQPPLVHFIVLELLVLRTDETLFNETSFLNIRFQHKL